MPLIDDAFPTCRNSGGAFEALNEQPADALLALIGACRADRRPTKIDVGVGVYRDESGRTPVFEAIKEAERRLVAEQDTKSYLGPEGDVRFCELLGALAFDAPAFGHRLCSLQTPGGTGALRLAAELIAAGRPAARVLVGAPTWANHVPILAAASLEVRTYPYFDVATQAVQFDCMMDAFETADQGDVVLLHGCCHNPLGADLDGDQWRAVAEVLARRGLVPLIDLAYHGLGAGLDEDATGVRSVLAKVDQALLAYSCDKNFGLYRERTGALFVLSTDARQSEVVLSNLLSLARANWSMPPDHGAALVRIVLDDPELTRSWRQELETMRLRVEDVRRQLAELDPFFAPVARQKGMFSTLPLDRDQILALRERHGVYMAGNGRINVAGLTAATAPALAVAIADVR